MSVEITPVLRHGWQGQVPSITDDEIRALLPIVQQGGSPVARMVRAYRMGRRDVEPAAQPLAGFERCPTCESVTVAAVAFSADPGEVDGRIRMWARCGEDGTTFRADTGAIHPADPAAEGHTDG